MKWLVCVLTAAAVGMMTTGCADDATREEKASQSQVPTKHGTVEQALWSACSSGNASWDCASDVQKFKDAHPCADWVSAPYCNSKGTCAITAQHDLSCENGGGECSYDSQCSYMSAWTGYKVVCQDYWCQQKWVGHTVGSSCDDGDPCTYSDMWNAWDQCKGTALSCGSGYYCSSGSCKPSYSCYDDGDPCTNDYWSNGYCYHTSKCGSGQYCSGGTCYYSSVSCDDGNACTYNDKKDAWGTCQGTTMSCSSGYYCSAGSCIWSGGSSSGSHSIVFGLLDEGPATLYSSWFQTPNGVGKSQINLYVYGSGSFIGSTQGFWGWSDIKTSAVSIPKSVPYVYVNVCDSTQSSCACDSTSGPNHWMHWGTLGAWHSGSGVACATTWQASGGGCFWRVDCD